MLKHLKLHNFRNHSDFETDLDQTTVFIGPNGVGKSNILESIAILSFCRSFRNDNKKNLIKIDADYARINGDLSLPGSRAKADEIEMFLQKTPSFIFQVKDKGVVKKQSEFIGRLRSVIFSPETLEIITGSPRIRRKFLDIMISQSDRDYLRTLVRYEKIRQERNSLLQRIRSNQASIDELDYWNIELVREGKKIIDARVKTIARLNEHLSALYSKISGKSDQLDLNYHTNAINNFSDELLAHQRREISSGHTLIGPHRDDLVFNLNNCNVANFASRGETRSAVLALKMAELEFLSDDKKNQPLLLLDDVFSEFDRSRREHLCDLIEKYQTIITTTEEEYLSRCLVGNAKIIKLHTTNSPIKQNHQSDDSINS
ncbi:DNA replication/repair protein RecF [Candidatus Berkelbacteria bacterium CG10_big_fil_rev_8_21_14_0_10_43_13]|uniref:DNA replication and repair protein RecF n=1 Tax=Candidatus Berkelbacteria bacterium CG10_big_fil_rev_8_21_14_0_10_43_13 TaxID=1974514 RepID=A0A2H0W7N6_9BACT|nr:MAG: DNA replication/repair protein RecF [Candidatus Berkelbacteria bacterium CG10_big_fil_rev_8_21_14_0_10_43_13]